LEERLTLLLHPVRLRLVRAMRAGGPLTTGELCQRLPDLPKATIYRQVDRLTRGGLFEVESERKVRGVVERRYRLNTAAAAVDAQDAKSMTIEDHRRGFTAATAALMADFNAYLDGDEASPVTDEVSYRQFVLWLTREERSHLVDELGRLVRARAGNPPGGAREPHVLSTVFFPARAGPADRA
jgi:DNA-binding transcriptional ArsR family regulator